MLQRWNIFLTLFAVTVGLLMQPVLVAQSGAGSIQGTITDATGAAVPGCSIHVVNQKTGVTTDTTSNEVGFYSVPGLFAGSYTITFSSPGMKKLEVHLTLQNAQVAVMSPKLSVGDLTEQVTVEGNTLQLATYDSGTVSTFLDLSRIDQLPQNSRSVLGLAQATVPGLEGGRDRQPTRSLGLRHGMLGVDDQVGQDLADLIVALCEAGLKSAEESGGMLINYTELPNAIDSDLAGHFHCTWSDEERRRMLRAQRIGGIPRPDGGDRPHRSLESRGPLLDGHRRASVHSAGRSATRRLC